MTLDDWLNRLYRAHVLTQESSALADTEFQAALAADSDLKAQAQTRLNSFAGIDEKRCFVTNQQRIYLTAALAA